MSTTGCINSFEPLVYDGAMMDMVRGRIVSWSYETESQDGSSTISAIETDRAIRTRRDCHWH